MEPLSRSSSQGFNKRLRRHYTRTIHPMYIQCIQCIQNEKQWFHSLVKGNCLCHRHSLLTGFNIKCIHCVKNEQKQMNLLPRRLKLLLSRQSIVKKLTIIPMEYLSKSKGHFKN
jgi:hypothetical protein